MRPFDVDKSYIEWSASKEWDAPYNMFFETTAPASPARRLLTDPDFLSNKEALDMSWTEYKVLVGLPAMGMAIDLEKYFVPSLIRSGHARISAITCVVRLPPYLQNRR